MADTPNGQAQSGSDINLVTLTADITAAFVGSQANHIAPSDVPGLITSIHSSLRGLTLPNEPETPKQEPAVSIRASIKPDYLVCLEDGKKLKMLKRYLSTHYNMTPDQYRQKWGLNADYPMVAPNYAEQRRTLAKQIGLGTQRTRSAEGRGGRRASGGETSGGEQASAPRRGRPKGSTNANKAAGTSGRGRRGKASNA